MEHMLCVPVWRDNPRAYRPYMFHLTCTMISSVDLAHHGASRAKDWVFVDCGTRLDYWKVLSKQYLTTKQEFAVLIMMMIKIIDDLVVLRPFQQYFSHFSKQFAWWFYVLFNSISVISANSKQYLTTKQEFAMLIMLIIKIMDLHHFQQFFSHIKIVAGWLWKAPAVWILTDSCLQ